MKASHRAFLKPSHASIPRNIQHRALLPCRAPLASNGSKPNKERSTMSSTKKGNASEKEWPHERCKLLDTSIITVLCQKTRQCGCPNPSSRKQSDLKAEHIFFEDETVTILTSYIYNIYWVLPNSCNSEHKPEHHFCTVKNVKKHSHPTKGCDSF